MICWETMSLLTGTEILDILMMMATSWLTVFNALKHTCIQICGKHYRRRQIFPADSCRPPTSPSVPEPEEWVWTRRSATFRVPRFALKPLPLLHQVSFIWLLRCWSNCEAESIFSSCSAGSAAEITWTVVRSGRKTDGRGINLYFPVLQLL